MRTGNPCASGQRLAVHRHRQHGVAPVHDDRRGRARGEPVGRARHDLVGALLHAGLLQQILQRRADPPRVADQVAAHLVRHAGEGDVALDQRALQQLRVVDRHRVIDHAVDVQVPAHAIHRRRHERGVDAVEVVGGRDEWAHAGHVELRAGRHRWRRAGGLGDPHRRAGRRRLRSAQQVLAGQARGRRRTRHQDTGDHEAAPVQLARALVGRRLRALGGHRAVGEVHRPPQRAEGQQARRRADDRRDRVDRTGPGTRDGREQAYRPQHAHADEPHAGTADRDDPQHRRDDREDDADAHEERKFVVRAERADGEGLQPARHRVDDGVAHRHHRRRVRAHDAGGQMRDAQRHRADQQTQERARDAVGADGIRWGRGYHRIRLHFHATERTSRIPIRVESRLTSIRLGR